MPCRPIVLSGPSGGGKSTILTRAMKEYPNSFAFSVSRELIRLDSFKNKENIFQTQLDNQEKAKSTESTTTLRQRRRCRK